MSTSGGTEAMARGARAAVTATAVTWRSLDDPVLKAGSTERGEGLLGKDAAVPSGHGVDVFLNDGTFRRDRTLVVVDDCDRPRTPATSTTTGGWTW